MGLVKPTMRPGSLEELIRLLPEGIGVIPLFVGIRRGTEDEFRDVMPAYEAKVAELVELGVDLVHPEGAPPFMVHGYRGEQAIIKGWEEKYKVPVVTAGSTQVDALRALGIRRIVGVTYFTGQINDTFSRYFTDAGFEVAAMEGISVAFEDVGKLSSEEVYAHTRKAFIHCPKADGIYMLGSGWRTLGIIEMLEQDMGVPVIHPVPARAWAIQRKLHVNQPVKGYGCLLEKMPPL
ncbi:MAG: hypothetical protein GTO40_29390 [Deltaproteobacteria bacterium]|nr:hypothetical protein [Deltaproteobacteria bacterium]